MARDRAARRRERKAKKEASAKAPSGIGGLPPEKPKTILSKDGQSAHPNFCFRYAAHKGDAPASFKPSKEEAEEIFVFLCEMGRLTWGEIENLTTGSGKKRHKSHHGYFIDKLTCKEAKDAISQQGLDEIFGDTVFRFRLGGKKRLWGFRNENTFHILWWDPDHQIYETKLT